MEQRDRRKKEKHVGRIKAKREAQTTCSSTRYSDDPSSNPVKVYDFSVIFLLKRTEIGKKTGTGPC